MAQHIVVTEYNPAWPEMFRTEAAAVREVLGGNCVAIHHIGSTAVPGLAAKPIIDLMPVVRSLEMAGGGALNPLPGRPAKKVFPNRVKWCIMASYLRITTKPIPNGGMT